MSLPIKQSDINPLPSSSSVVWCVTDGKPGHESQLRGLVSALERRRVVDVHWLNAPTRWKNWRDWMTGHSSLGQSLPSPNLIIAAGHATHSAALSVRRTFGGRVVLLMRPSLPTQWFDLCLIPEHDLDRGSPATDSENVILTCGVLNTVRSESRTNASRGLLLIGGPSKHHDWHDQSMCNQVLDVVRSSPGLRWTLTTSRRTPESFLPRVSASRFPNLSVVPASETASGWVAARLLESKTVFVSEDSVSMVYEALSANADVGLLQVPRRRTSRVIRGVDRLAESRHVIPFEQWKIDRFAHREPCVLQEADRCAEIVCTRLLDAA